MVAPRPSYPAVEALLATCVDVSHAVDNLRQHLTLMGGLLPSIAIDQATVPADDRHVGTLGVDLILSLDVDEGIKLVQLGDRLSDLGFEQVDRRLRWRRAQLGGPGQTIDIVLTNSVVGYEAWLPEVRLATEFRTERTLVVRNSDGFERSGTMWTATVGAFLNLKAIAFDRRRDPKDAYDMMHTVRYYRGPVDQQLAACSRSPGGRAFFDLLDREFRHEDDPGPLAVARFRTGQLDDDVQAEVVSLATRVLANHGL